MVLPTSLYPKGHSPIIADWVISGGGLRAYGYTTDEGDPRMAVVGFDKDYKIITPMQFFEASHHCGAVHLKKDAFDYRIPFIVSITPKELMLFAQPPEELGLSDEPVRTPWLLSDMRQLKLDGLDEPERNLFMDLAVRRHPELIY